LVKEEGKELKKTQVRAKHPAPNPKTGSKAEKKTPKNV